jgi:TetR/AcrR family tetracycline transcriptional repressor
VTNPAGRRTRGRPPLPREDIVAAALAILDEEGADALSLRALAQRLESGTATLYRHFDSRADLLDEVVDRVLGNIQVDVEALAEMSWQDACRALAHALFDVLSQHRHAVPLLAQHIPMGPNAMLQRERALALLLGQGFSPDLAVGAYTTISRHVLGFAMQLSGRAPLTEETEAAMVSAQVHAADAKRFPATAAVADAMPVPLESEFEFGLTLLIAGLETVRSREAAD